ncbi:peroxidase-related enzyme [Actinocrispum wychmicini]|uniref:Putative peroxidase-related enzyme n=1 Tax=Actinocrispum wychmicini TaxID=1213861 RepID=A0A4R2JJQ7_9PSEU|nr:peroxidase-related enzyme [Actinocrispum wychmicini]TCO54405.1 putative peroxidase-related enzyme [Actinocrispum wychmicini]
MADQVASGVRVPLVDEREATGRTAELYELIRSSTNFPFVPDMFRLASTKPALMETVIAGYRGTFLTEGALSRNTKELIASWTSRVNQCPYCVGTHNFFLQAFGGTKELADAIAAASSPDDLPVDDPTKALLRLLTKVSTAAYRITDEDWEATLAAGWTSEELLEGVFTAALFNFITRLVDSLGLGTSVSQSRISQQPVTESGTAA